MRAYALRRRVTSYKTHPFSHTPSNSTHHFISVSMRSESIYGMVSQIGNNIPNKLNSFGNGSRG